MHENVAKNKRKTSLAFKMLLFWLFKIALGFNAGIIAIAAIGIITILFKKQLMNFIEQKYLRDKYAAIKAFEQKA